MNIRPANGSRQADALKRDLSLVITDLDIAHDATITASVDGKTASVDRAIAHAAGMLHAAAAPALIGVEWMTVEAALQAVELTEAMGGLMLPAGPVDPTGLRRTVTHSLTLDAACTCDMVVWVGGGARRGPIADVIGQGNSESRSVEDGLDAVLALRSKLAEAKTVDDTAAVIVGAKRVAIVLAPDVDARVAGQWHKLADDLQLRVRMGVVGLPDPMLGPNRRGAHEAVCWQSGAALSAGGIDWAEGAAKTNGSDSTVLHRGGVDVVIDAAGLATHVPARRIAIGRADDSHAEVCFRTPGLAFALAARVMRFDGAMLWLCEDPATAPPDPTVELLQRLCLLLSQTA